MANGSLLSTADIWKGPTLLVWVATRELSGRLKQQTFISYGSGGWEVQGQGTNRFDVWWEAFFLVCRWPPSSCVLMTKRKAPFLVPLFIRARTHSWGLRPHELITSQISHLQIPSHWGLGFNIWMRGGWRWQTFRLQLVFFWQRSGGERLQEGDKPKCKPKEKKVAPKVILFKFYFCKHIYVCLSVFMYMYTYLCVWGEKDE